MLKTYLTMEYLFSVLFLAILSVDVGTCYTIRRNEKSKGVEIFGGRFASKAEAPYFVQVFLNDKLQNYHWQHDKVICGGALISFRHVLTAAHCIEEFREFSKLSLSVVAGTISRASDESRTSYGVWRDVELFFIHPDFNIDEPNNNDIAILRLEKPFSKTNYVGQIPLPNHPAILGEKVTLYGFGVYDEDYDRGTEYLKKLTTIIINCGRYITDDRQICSKTSRSTGMCDGDSGGPLVNEKGELVGIISRGTYECAEGIPDIHVSVYNHLKFINNVITK